MTGVAVDAAAVNGIIRTTQAVKAAAVVVATVVGATAATTVTESAIVIVVNVTTMPTLKAVEAAAVAGATAAAAADHPAVGLALISILLVHRVGKVRLQTGTVSAIVGAVTAGKMTMHAAMAGRMIAGAVMADGTATRAAMVGTTTAGAVMAGTTNTRAAMEGMTTAGTMADVIGTGGKSGIIRGGANTTIMIAAIGIRIGTIMAGTTVGAGISRCASTMICTGGTMTMRGGSGMFAVSAGANLIRTGVTAAAIAGMTGTGPGIGATTTGASAGS